MMASSSEDCLSAEECESLLYYENHKPETDINLENSLGLTFIRRIWYINSSHPR